VLALEKLPEKYVNAFCTLNVNRNVDLEKLEDVVKAIYRANQGKSKDDSDDEDEVNLDEDDEKKNITKDTHVNTVVNYTCQRKCFFGSKQGYTSRMV
jgi:hypothetical protein